MSLERELFKKFLENGKLSPEEEALNARLVRENDGIFDEIPINKTLEKHSEPKKEETSKEKEIEKDWLRKWEEEHEN